MQGSSARAVIWDLDGVIADTAPYHQRAWQETFRKRGVKFTEEDFRQSFGLRNDTIISNILDKEISQEEISGIAKEKEESFRRGIRDNIKPLPGVIKLIKSLDADKFQQAIASSTPQENIRLVTEGLDIRNYFQVIIGDEDVSEGKPNPQVFLLAAERLEVEPKHCIVIEDAVAGVSAAKRAGMRCLAVTNTNPRNNLKEADLVVDSLEVITMSDLEGLLN